ncbi:MAG TPA: glycosyltransferase family 2 protein, partial [Longimicrobiales bacterium]|nr:glycosyltransferase family 2 protein [Longimicrobiales bacterium]
RFPVLTAHIRSRCPEIHSEKGVGTIFAMRGGTRDAALWHAVFRELLEGWEEQTGAPPSVLDLGTSGELSVHLPGRAVFTPPLDGGDLPYLDASVDVVAVADDSPWTLAEARRVARRSVIRFGAPGTKDGQAGDLVIKTIEHREEEPDPLPTTSIVVPTYNGLDQLVPCLRALNDTLPSRFGGEVLVVDDASGSRTAEGLEDLSREYGWLRVVRNEQNSGFIASCNRGASEATGDYLVFLNDDTVPLPGWLPALLKVFRTHPDAGAVGGRLVYPDGRLQEAGAVIFDDGSGANFGRGDYEVDAPVYAFVRPVHYCSGALLATPRRLFLELGGFDARYRPAYYEDTDYCFTVRGSGRRVYYQPEATIVHVEGASSGTDPNNGVKRYQTRNRHTFRKKWRAELRTLTTAPGAYSAQTWHRLAFYGGDL